jgi:DNA-binding response OmpR family regulator
VHSLEPGIAVAGKGTILAVDDTHDSLRLITEILTTAGYRVHPADSGELALASVVASPPDLILLDIMMPGIGGFEVLRWLKAREGSRDIPVIFLSALNETSQRVEGLKLGAVDFIAKPFQTEELLARVQTHVELRRVRVQLELQADQLRAALAKVKLLSGFIPICANCKKIRDDKGYWGQIETYIRDHSEAEFSHGICPECTKVLYPGYSSK